MPETNQAAGPAASAPVTHPRGFAAIDNRIVMLYGERIGACGLALYLVLAVHADHATRACFPSLETLSRYLQVSRPTVLKTIRVLEEAGLVRVARRRSERGSRRVNVYTLLPLPDGQPALPPAAGEVNDVDHDSKAALPPIVNVVDQGSKAGLPEQDVINKTQENQREGVGGAANPSHPVASPSHPAIKAYCAACKLTPDATQRAAIAATVTDLTKWAEVVRQWLLAGYRKQNVAGMLDWYRDGIPERSGAHGRHAAGGRAGGGLGFSGQRPGNRAGEWGESRPPETPADTARLDAEWDGYVTEARNRSQSDAA